RLVPPVVSSEADAQFACQWIVRDGGLARTDRGDDGLGSDRRGRIAGATLNPPRRCFTRKNDMKPFAALPSRDFSPSQTNLTEGSTMPKPPVADARPGEGGELHQTASTPDTRLTTNHGVPV